MPAPGQGAALFSDHRGVEGDIAMVLRDAGMPPGIGPAINGETIEEGAASVLGALVAGGPAGVGRERAKCWRRTA